MIAVIKKEMKSYFTSIIGYVLLAGFVLMSGLYYTIYCIRYLYPDYSVVLNAISIVFLIMIPLLTMRLFSEESRQKTDQLLYTSPLKIEQIVIGKYLSALLFFLIGIGITILFPLSLTFFGEIPVPQTVGAFIGYILLGAAFISVGIFVSVLTDNQIVAAFATFGSLFLLFMLSGLKEIAPTSTASSIGFVCILILLFCYILYDATRNIFAGIAAAGIGLVIVAVLAIINPLFFDGAIVKTLDWFSLMNRFNNFSSGILNISDIVYYITFSVVFIYLTINVIEKRRWK